MGLEIKTPRKVQVSCIGHDLREVGVSVVSSLRAALVLTLCMSLNQYEIHVLHVLRILPSNLDLT